MCCQYRNILPSHFLQLWHQHLSHFYPLFLKHWPPFNNICFTLSDSGMGQQRWVWSWITSENVLPFDGVGDHTQTANPPLHQCVHLHHQELGLIQRSDSNPMCHEWPIHGARDLIQITGFIQAIDPQPCSTARHKQPSLAFGISFILLCWSVGQHVDHTVSLPASLCMFNIWHNAFRQMFLVHRRPPVVHWWVRDYKLVMENTRKGDYSGANTVNKLQTINPKAQSGI